MKKSNVIIFILLAAASAFFLWLWYYLGLNHVDEPLDLVLSVLWWVVVAAAVVLIVRMEQVRRWRVRTVYVSDRTAFNSEKGLMTFEGAEPMQDAVASILRNLTYDFTRKDFPERDEFDARYFIRTKEFGVEKTKDDQAIDADGTAGAMEAKAATALQASQLAPSGDVEPKKWKGEVVVVETKEERAFDTPEELAVILASLDQMAA